MSYFDNIYEYIEKYMHEITLIVCFCVFVFMFFMLYIMFKKSKYEKTLLKELKITINRFTNLDGTFNDIQKNNKMIEDITDTTDTILKKITALIEIQYTVYAGHGGLDDDTRTAINNIYTNIKYAESKTRADLLKKLNELSKAFDEQKEAYEKKLIEAKFIVNPNSKDTDILRG